MRTVNVERMRRYVGDRLRRTALVRPEDVKVGDRVLVEMEVFLIGPVTTGREFEHIHARVPRPADHPWNLGDQEAWTWGWSSDSNGNRIEVLR